MTAADAKSLKVDIWHPFVMVWKLSASGPKKGFNLQEDISAPGSVSRRRQERPRSTEGGKDRDEPKRLCQATYPQPQWRAMERDLCKGLQHAAGNV
jgi:hypothetical protein